MALPQEGLLTLQQVNIELSKEPEAHITMNDSDVRALAKRPVNESSISFDDLKGRTTGIAEYTIRRGHVDEDLIRMVNRELGDLSKVHIIFEDGITVVNQVFFDQSIANDITKGPYKMSGNTITDLSRFFRGCENMTEIGAELFYGLPKLKFIGSIFMNCPIKQYHSAMFKFNPELKELPPGVLDDNVIVPVDVFEGSAIEVISGNVRNESLDILNPIKNTIREINASIFQGQTIDPTMFADCINLFSVMKLSGNFEDRKGAFTTGFAGGAWLKADTFKDLLKLNTISSLNVRGYDVGFLNNLPKLLNVHNIDAPQVPIVGRIFDTCPNLNNITKLFGNANVEYTNRTLVSVDEHIFDNCPNILICSEAFANCVNFTGKVPELWKRSNAPSIIHYDYAKGTINASNYIEIPTDWGGGELPKEQTFTSKEDFDNRIQNLIASGKMKEMSFTFDGDFTQEPNLIRFPVETTETPNMIKTTHKITVNGKEYYYLNIDSMFEDCVNLKYINPSLFSTNEYGKYQFIKTARKTFKNACVDGTEFPTGIFNVVEGLYDVSECFMNSKCTFGTSGPFKEKHHLMKCVSTFENSKITDNLAVFWQGIDGRFQGELEYPQRDLTRMYANTRLISPYALWNGSFINAQGGITYPVICDEMFAETDITNASMAVDSKAAGKMESIKGMFKGSKVTKSKDLNTFTIAKYADYMYQNTPITSVGDLNSSTVISLEGIFDNCIQLQTATVDLTEENYSQRYPLNKNANWKFAFRNCNALTKAPNLWDIYKGESEDCFKGCGSASNFSEVPIEWGGTEQTGIVYTFTSKEDFDSRIQGIIDSGEIKDSTFKFTYSPVKIQFPRNIVSSPKYIECDELDCTKMFQYCRELIYISETLLDKVNHLINGFDYMLNGIGQIKTIFNLSKYKDKIVEPVTCNYFISIAYTNNINNIPLDFFDGLKFSAGRSLINTIRNDHVFDFSNCTIEKSSNMYSNTYLPETISKKLIPISKDYSYLFENCYFDENTVFENDILLPILKNNWSTFSLFSGCNSMNKSNINFGDLFTQLKEYILDCYNNKKYEYVSFQQLFSNINIDISIDFIAMKNLFQYLYENGVRNYINIFSMFSDINLYNKDTIIENIWQYDELFSSTTYCFKGLQYLKSYIEIPYAYGGPSEVHRFANKAAFEEYKDANSNTNWYDTVIIFENGLENETLDYLGTTIPLIIWADKCTSIDRLISFPNNTTTTINISPYLFYGMPNLERLTNVFMYYINLNFQNNDIFENNKKINYIENLFYVGDMTHEPETKIENLTINLDNPDLIIKDFIKKNNWTPKSELFNSNISINCKSLKFGFAIKLYTYGNFKLGKDIENLDLCFSSIDLPSSSYFRITTFDKLKSCEYAFMQMSNTPNKLSVNIVNKMLSSPVLENCEAAFKDVPIQGDLNIPDTVTFSTLTNCSELFNGQSNLTGKAPRLWELAPNAIHTNCFKGCTSLSNYNEIPDDWK